MIRLRNGHWLMVHNDLERGRYSLVAALSDDEGKTWTMRRHLEGRPDAEAPDQYHYPSVIQARDGVHPRHLQLLHAGRQIDQARALQRGLGSRRGSDEVKR